MRSELPIDRAAVLTGWGYATADNAPHVTRHAIPRLAADTHRAVCGAHLPVVDRKQLWAADDEICCAGCVAVVA
ncbi:hypothetical protein [Geodermatophilus sp. SYSU D01176]